MVFTFVSLFLNKVTQIETAVWFWGKYYSRNCKYRYSIHVSVEMISVSVKFSAGRVLKGVSYGSTKFRDMWCLIYLINIL